MNTTDVGDAVVHAPAPAYTALDDGEDLYAWIDRMAARADELGLPLTSGTRSPMVAPRRNPFQSAAATAPPSARAVVADLKQQIVDGFFSAVRGGLTDAVERYVGKGLVSPDVHEGTTLTAFVRREGGGADEVRQPGAGSRDGATGGEDPVGTGSEGASEGAGRPAEPAEPTDFSAYDDQYDFLLGTTPLLAAVDAGRIAMVRTLLALGADVDRLAVPSGFWPSSAVLYALWDAQADVEAAQWGLPPQFAEPPSEARKRWSRAKRLEIDRARRMRRTPLMAAAATGRLAMVELLLRRAAVEGLGAGEPADDAIVAPDGQTALRLAAAGGHRDVVAVLPARRGGGWQRFRMRHVTAMERAERAAVTLAVAARIVVWDGPKVLAWDAPRAVVRWVRTHGGVLAVLHRAGRAVLKVAGQFVRELVAALRRLPAGLRRLGVWLAVDLPRKIAGAGRATAAAARRLGAWARDALVALGRVLANAVQRAVSVLHTAVVAVVTWLRTATLADIGRGLRRAGAAIFVDLPRWAAHAVRRLGATVADILKTSFGLLGVLVVVLVQCVWAVLLWVPKQLWRIVSSGGQSVAAGVHEAAVFVNPKL